jgi:hypothetical protein
VPRSASAASLASKLLGGRSELGVAEALQERRRSIIANPQRRYDLVIWMANGEVKAKDGAVAPAHHVGLGDVPRVEQGDDVVGHKVVAVWAGLPQ